jgi:tetratricopeptide (TPR) repeat protein
VRFTHDKLRDVARASLPEGARAAIHARAAAAIRRFEDVGSPGVLAELAVHHREAGDAETARECYVAAAAAARSTHPDPAAERLYRELLAQPGTPPPVRVEARRALATLLTEAWGRAAEAEEQLLAALAEAPPDIPPARRADIVRCLGLSRAHQGRPAEALRSYDEALAAARTLGDRAFEALVTHNRAVVLRSTGDVAAARQCLERALGTFRDLGLGSKAGRSLGVLAALAAEEGRLAEARSLYEESVAALRDAADHIGEAAVSANFANLLCDGIAMQLGLAKQREAVALHRELGLPIHESLSLGNLSRVELALGHVEEAREHALKGLDLSLASGSLQARVSCLVALGEHGLAAGELDVAQQSLEEALALAAGDPRLDGAARMALGRLAAQRGDLAVARRLLSTARGTYESRGIRRGEALTSLELAGIERASGDVAEARRWLGAAESALGSGGAPLDRARCLVERARIEAGGGPPDAALLDAADGLLLEAELPPGSLERRDVVALRAARPPGPAR